MSYSAIVLYYRHGARVLDTINGLRAQTIPPQRIVVVDNDSRDGVLDELAPSLGGVRVVTAPTNLGYAGGMNLGLATEELASADWVLFLTHEVSLHSGCVERMMGAADNGTVMVGPMLRLHGDETDWSWGGTFTRFGATRHRRHASDGELLWLDGACLLVRSTQARAQLFDERFFLYWEDVEVSTRLREVGSVILAEGAVAFQSTSHTPPYYSSRNRVMYWVLQRKPLKATVGAVDALTRALVKDLPRWRSGGDQRAHARVWGVLDALTGRLHDKCGRVPDAHHRSARKASRA